MAVAFLLILLSYRTNAVAVGFDQQSNDASFLLSKNDSDTAILPNNESWTVAIENKQVRYLTKYLRTVHNFYLKIFFSILLKSSILS